MSHAYRIVKTKYADLAFTGEGAKLYGGRWNSRGKRATYAAQSIALAALELLVHLKSDRILSAYTLFQLTLDDDQIMVLDEQVLPADWNHQPAPQSTAQIGDEWLGKCLSLALKVPSIIVPEEYIFVLNPAHEDYPDVVGRAGSHPFQFDSRLAKPTKFVGRESFPAVWACRQRIADLLPKAALQRHQVTSGVKTPLSRYYPCATAH